MSLVKSQAIGAMALLCAACATPVPDEDVRPGERPSLETDEAGLWMTMDRIDEGTRTSGKVVADPELNDYVEGILCKLAPDHCSDIELFIVRRPNFNATMAPNGTMHVWTGLLLRADNEAQVAFVLGHEMGHYLRRHTLRRWRDIRAKTDAFVFFQLATAAAGYGFVNQVAALLVEGSIYAFTRDQEREADRIGFERMTAAGYDPREASKVWSALKEEKDADDGPEPSLFFSSHPSSRERLKTLAAMAEATPDKSETVSVETHLAATGAFRETWLRDELRERNFGRMKVLLRQMMEAEPNSTILNYYHGEFYRLRDKDGDGEQAVEAYEKAMALGDAPPESHRSLGLVQWSMDRPGAARESFERYLRIHPDASDKAMIESYIAELKEGAT